MKVHPQINFDKTPFLVIWETTRACDLACVHCRASANPNPEPDELSHEEAIEMLNQIRRPGTPVIVFSGGDPLKRKRLPELIAHAKSLGFRTGTIPAVTPLVTREKLRELKMAGLDQIAFSLDAASPEEHDRFRRVDGVFKRTLESVRLAQEEGLAVQINSLVNIHNEKQLADLIRLVESLGIVFWEVFFLVPVGRGGDLPLMSGRLFEKVFEPIYELNKRASFIIKITEAPHYRRYFIQREGVSQGALEANIPSPLRRPDAPGVSIGHAPGSVNAGKGFAFVSYNGQVFPSGFLPLAAGSVREKPFDEIYQNSVLMRRLRDTSLLKGRCGICSFKDICGGSRSRAYALSGDYLAEDPSCSYQPAEALV